MGGGERGGGGGRGREEREGGQWQQAGASLGLTPAGWAPTTTTVHACG